MDTEKVNEFKNYLQEIISNNAPDVLGTRATRSIMRHKYI